MKIALLCNSRLTLHIVFAERGRRDHGRVIDTVCDCVETQNAIARCGTGT